VEPALSAGLSSCGLARYPDIKRLVVHSRDELKQFEVTQIFDDTRYPDIRYFIGDIRDLDRLRRAPEKREVRTMSALPDEYACEEVMALQTTFPKSNSKRWWILSSVGFFTGVFAAAALVMSPTYRASVVLAPVTSERREDALGLTTSRLGGLASGLGLETADTEEALAVLRSREFTESFIASHKLLPRLFHDKWNPVTGTWKAAVGHPPTTGKAFKYFDRNVRSIVQDRKTGLITVQIDWIDRNEAAVWANTMVQDLNEEMRARAIAKADASQAFLAKELQTTSTIETRDAINRLIESQVKQRMLAHVTYDYSFRVVDKAIAADIDDRIAPQRAVTVLLGAVLGLLVGSWAALSSTGFGARKRSPRRYRQP
jgi:hypothetical protein